VLTTAFQQLSNRIVHLTLLLIVSNRFLLLTWTWRITRGITPAPQFRQLSNCDLARYNTSDVLHWLLQPCSNWTSSISVSSSQTRVQISTTSSRVFHALHVVTWLAAWLSGSAFVSDKEVTRRRTRLVALGDPLRAGKPPRFVTSHSGQLSLLSSAGRCAILFI